MPTKPYDCVRKMWRHDRLGTPLKEENVERNSALLEGWSKTGVFGSKITLENTFSNSGDSS